MKWASTRENLSLRVCEQHGRRPACASAQSDQRLWYSRFEKYHTLACYKRNFIFLASLCSWAGWFESHLVGNPKDRFCRDEAQIGKVSWSDVSFPKNIFKEFRSLLLSFDTQFWFKFLQVLIISYNTCIHKYLYVLTPEVYFCSKFNKICFVCFKVVANF